MTDEPMYKQIASDLRHVNSVTGRSAGRRRAWHDTLRSATEVKTRYGVELRHCPFCTSPNIALYLSGDPHVTCLDCCADGPFREGSRHDREERNHQACLDWNGHA